MNRRTIIKMILISPFLKFTVNIKKYFKIKKYKNYRWILKSDDWKMLKKIENIKVENYDFVIVGTGPAGISLAFQLKKNDKKKFYLSKLENLI